LGNHWTHKGRSSRRKIKKGQYINKAGNYGEGNEHKEKPREIEGHIANKKLRECSPKEGEKETKQAVHDKCEKNETRTRRRK
jgi:hypothetical protein